MRTYSIDYETRYDKEFGIEELGLWHYIHDDRFDPYLVAIWGEDVKWVGNPKDFDWGLVAGADEFISHNHGFDARVHARCIELGIIPRTATPKKWYCSASLSVYIGGPRNLKDATKYLLGTEISKEMRDYMRGRTWVDAVAEGKAEQLKQYALDDAKYCYELWQKYNHEWPETERQIAELTFKQTDRGIAVDLDLLNSSLPSVIKARDGALEEIPWANEPDESGDIQKPLSIKSLKTWLKSKGIEPPTCTEAKNPDFVSWQKEHEDVSVIKAMQTYRSANALSMKAETIRRQIRPDGRYGFNSLYFGASTGRRSGGYADDRNDSGGVNVLNLLKEEMFGMNLRKLFVAPKGKKFIIADFEQAEPRCLAWLGGDTEFLDVLRSGVPLYEAHARAQGSWTGTGVLKKENPKLYLQKKAETLGLGFGSGWQKFVLMCAIYGASDCLMGAITDAQKNNFLRYIQRTNQQDKLKDLKTDLDWTKAVNAWIIVTNFRATKPKITGLWNRLERDCMKCTGTDYKVELPSGRILKYWNVKTLGGMTAQKCISASPIRVWGSFLTENITQATARDVMCNAMLNVEKEGVMTLFDVYDELICEVDSNFDMKIVKQIMEQTPSWMPGLPLSVSIEESDFYRK